MSRCDHGFNRAVVACPMCDGGEKPRARVRNRTRYGRAQFHPVTPGNRPMHPGFRDETGRVYAGAIVLGRLPNNPKGEACWTILQPCGHQRAITGIHLRDPRRRRWLCATCAELRRSAAS